MKRVIKRMLCKLLFNYHPDEGIRFGNIHNVHYAGQEERETEEMKNPLKVAHTSFTPKPNAMYVCFDYPFSSFQSEKLKASLKHRNRFEVQPSLSLAFVEEETSQYIQLKSLLTKREQLFLCTHNGSCLKEISLPALGGVLLNLQSMKNGIYLLKTSKETYRITVANPQQEESLYKNLRI